MENIEKNLFIFVDASIKNPLRPKECFLQRTYTKV